MKLYGLIGYPLGHSFSKKYFTDKFQRENLPHCSYEQFPLPSIKDLLSLIQSNPLLIGLNVTIPYKESVLEFVTNKSAEVKLIGAANTLKFTGKNITAYNTDALGFQNSFIKKLKPFHKKALVLGTGGASKAVQFILKKLSLDYLLVTRNESPAQGVINYSMIDKKITEEYPVIINCTPVGMFPLIKSLPFIDYNFLSEKNYLFDLVYNPQETLFLKKGKERGAVIQNGYEMLVNQAEESWKIWNED